MKTKKKIIYILLPVLISFFVFSCTKLKDESYDEILTEGFEPTDDDVAAIVASAYSSWREVVLLWNGYWRAQEATADEIVYPPRPNGWVDGGIYRLMHRHTWTYSDDIVYETWTRCYAGIADCNLILYEIESGFLELEDTEDEVVAETRLVRASYYYMLCDMYGNVPIVTDFDVEDGYIPPYSTRQEVYDFIISEITESVEDLGTDRGGLYYGRFNKWAAYTLLAKMYLNAEVYTGTAQWDACIVACDSVINSGVGYALEDNQKDVFVTENESSVEILYALPIDETYTDDWNTFDLHMQTLQPANQGTYELSETPWGGPCATPQFIESFDPDDERLTENFIYGQQFDSDGDSLMCTLGDSVGLPLYYINEVLPIDEECEEGHGYRFGKYEVALGSSNILNNDFVVFRYADILMMKAECLLRQGNSDEAATLVTQVRTRAFTDNPDKATVTGSELLETSSYPYGLRDEGYLGTTDETEAITYGRFLDELGWEFNQEGRRRQDLIRFGVFTTRSWLSHPAQDDDHTCLFPIPKTALETNENLQQNTGY